MITIILIIVGMATIVIAVAPSLFNYLEIQNNLGQSRARFYVQGNISMMGDCTYGGVCSITKGTCTLSSSCNAPSNSLIIQNKTGATIAYIGSLGGTFCTRGSITQNHAMTGVCTTPSLNITNSTNAVVVCIDASGNLYARGKIACTDEIIT